MGCNSLIAEGLLQGIELLLLPLEPLSCRYTAGGGGGTAVMMEEAEAADLGAAADLGTAAVTQEVQAAVLGADAVTEEVQVACMCTAAMTEEAEAADLSTAVMVLDRLWWELSPQGCSGFTVGCGQEESSMAATDIIVSLRSESKYVEQVQNRPKNTRKTATKSSIFNFFKF